MLDFSRGREARGRENVVICMYVKGKILHRVVMGRREE